jgi:hypothetical protein
VLLAEAMHAPGGAQPARLAAAPSLIALSLERAAGVASDARIAYPASLYIDPFVEPKRARADALWRDGLAMREEIDHLVQRKQALRGFEVRDPVAVARGSVAEAFIG